MTPKHYYANSNTAMMMMGGNKDDWKGSGSDHFHSSTAQASFETRFFSKIYDPVPFHHEDDVPRELSTSPLEPNPINPGRMQVVSRLDLRGPNYNYGGGEHTINNTPLLPFLPFFSCSQTCDANFLTRMSQSSQEVAQNYYEKIEEQEACFHLSEHETHHNVLCAGETMNVLERVESIPDEERSNFDDHQRIIPTPTTSGSLTAWNRESATIGEQRGDSSVDPSMQGSNARVDNGGPGDQNYSNRWNDKLNELKSFIRAHGHARVPVRYNLNLPLSKWAKRQRYQWKLKHEGKHSTLTDSREDKLEQVGFLWDIRLTVWEERYDELLEFLKSYGHCNVPISCVDYPKLRTWVKCQRRQWKLRCSGQQSSMTPSRILKLDAIGFSWEAR